MSPSAHSILVTQKSDFVDAWRFVNTWLHSLSSLHRKRNLTPVSNVWEAAPWFMFWTPNGLKEFPEVRFVFPFILIGKSTMAFLTGQSWRVLRFWYTCGGAQDKDFGAVSLIASHAGVFRRARISSPPSYKRLVNREQHSFPKLSQSHCTFQILESWPWPQGNDDNYSICMKH